MDDSSFNRRHFLGAATATVAGAVAGVWPSKATATATNVTVGLIYVGPRDDYGWNQAHAVAAKALRNVPGVKVVEEENVAETVAVRKTMEGMVQSDGASLIFGTSFGYFDPFMIDMARKYPKVEFRHPTSLRSADKHPMNLGGYFCFPDQAHYVNGIAAGLSTKTQKIGYVAAKPIAIVLRNINAFTLGVRKVNPNAVVQLIIAKGQKLPNTFFGGYDKDMVASTPFGAGATEAARHAATAAIAELKAGKPIFAGPINSNAGKVVIDKTYGNYDPFLDRMNFLIEGVYGSL